MPVFTESTEKYDTRDVDRLQQDDALVEGYLTWRLYSVDEALKMIDESFQWRKEYGLNGKKCFISLATCQNQLVCVCVCGL